MAFGWLGIMPEVWYDMQIDDFFLMVKGFQKRKEYGEGLFKRLAYIVHASMVSKPLNPDKLWPMNGEKRMTQDDLNKRSEIMMKRIELMQKIEDEKKKHARGIKTNN